MNEGLDFGGRGRARLGLVGAGLKSEAELSGDLGVFEVQQDELVGDDALPLEVEGLGAGPWVAFEDVGLAGLFELCDLFVDELDHDLIVG